MKILSKEQVYEADKITCKSQQISSDELMERAGMGIFNWLHSRLQGKQVKIHIFCGIGNNGGDGLVIARYLKNNGYNFKVYVVSFSDKRSKDFELNFNRLQEIQCFPELITSENDFPEILNEEIVIDAIFGIGLSRPPSDWVISLIKKINSSNVFVLSVDVPSGLYMDKVPENEHQVIKANYTLTFETPKLPFFLPQTGIFSNGWEIISIGIDQTFMDTVQAEAHFILKEDALPLYIPREKFTHKGTYGHSLIIGGSYGKIGAAVLSAKACLKSGAGLVTTYIPKCGYNIMQTSVPECMVITDESENIISNIQYKIKPTVIGFGVGIGKDKKTARTFKQLLTSIQIPIVIDADGINLLSENRDLINEIPPKSVLTPHPKELERLIGKWKDDFEKIKKVKEFSAEYDCVVVIKGAHTLTVYRNDIYVNSTGNPGMATAGSGDVLTGIITGLISQGYGPVNACIFGIYLHGLAADIAIQGESYESLTASEIIKNTGNAFNNLNQNDTQKSNDNY